MILTAPAKMPKAEHTIRVADYSITPGGRYADHGPFPGDEWRDRCLWPAVQDALRMKTNLLVDLDGTAGLASSFLEEAFGGLVRNHGCDGRQLLDLLIIKSVREPYLVDDVREFILDAQPTGK